MEKLTTKEKIILLNSIKFGSALMGEEAFNIIKSKIFPKIEHIFNEKIPT